MAAADYRTLLASTRRIVLIDYPGRIVPDSLAKAGFEVVAHEGPGENEYHEYSVVDGAVIRGDGGPAPAAADLVFSHRPIDELGPIAEEAARIKAKAVWLHSGIAEGGGRDPRGCWLSDEDRATARSIVEGAGLEYVDSPFILDAVEERGLR